MAGKFQSGRDTERLCNHGNWLTPACVHTAWEERDSCCAAASVLSVCQCFFPPLSVIHLFSTALKNGRVAREHVKNCVSLTVNAGELAALISYVFNWIQFYLYSAKS